MGTMKNLLVAAPLLLGTTVLAQSQNVYLKCTGTVIMPGQNTNGPIRVPSMSVSVNEAEGWVEWRRGRRSHREQHGHYAVLSGRYSLRPN
jgi:hypothetical protein